MPLIEPGDSISTILYVDCLCGHRANNYAQHYRHIADCKLTRCQSCLTVLRDGTLTDDRFDDSVTHECPSTRIRKLEQGRS